MVGTDKTTIENYGECIRTIRWNNIHNPQGIINQRSSKTSISCIHIHHISDTFCSKIRQQCLVMGNSLFPFTVIMIESTSARTMNNWKPFGCSVQPLRPFRHVREAWVLVLIFWNNEASAKGSVPCWIWFETVVTFWRIGLSRELVVATVIRGLLPYSDVVLFVV